MAPRINLGFSGAAGQMGADLMFRTREDLRAQEGMSQRARAMSDATAGRREGAMFDAMGRQVGMEHQRSMQAAQFGHQRGMQTAQFAHDRGMQEGSQDAAMKRLLVGEDRADKRQAAQYEFYGEQNQLDRDLRQTLATDALHQGSVERMRDRDDAMTRFREGLDQDQLQFEASLDQRRSFAMLDAGLTLGKILSDHYGRKKDREFALDMASRNERLGLFQ
ncbi:MAG: hypothetical protein MJA83_09925, partial [Gammaproteobacteria bacterium]|nr:hypothetical protein [Gammaproteobacteria bacterium]